MSRSTHTFVSTRPIACADMAWSASSSNSACTCRPVMRPLLPVNPPLENQVHEGRHDRLLLLQPQQPPIPPLLLGEIPGDAFVKGVRCEFSNLGKLCCV